MKKLITLITMTFSFCVVSYSTQAEGLGRLFTSPEERAMLERLRQPVLEKVEEKKFDPIKIVIHEDFPKPAVEKPLFHQVITQEEIYPPEKTVTEEVVIVEEPKVIVIEKPDLKPITVNGIVKRSNGRSTAWVNGISTDSGYLSTQNIVVNPRRIGRDHVHVEIEDVIMEDVSLKVGQTLDPDQAKITDAYQDIVTPTTR